MSEALKQYLQKTKLVKIGNLLIRRYVVTKVKPRGDRCELYNGNNLLDTVNCSLEAAEKILNAEAI